MRLSIALVSSLFSLYAIESHAQTAQQLLSACKPIAEGKVTEAGIAFPHTYETGLCWGLFSMLQLNIVHVDAQKKPLYSTCAPGRATRAQMVQIFVKYAESVPERLHEDGNELALESAQQAFPCAGQRK